MGSPDDPALQGSSSSEDEARWIEGELERRRRARALAAELGLDESEVYHQLKQLEREPLERLRRGLSHGRRRPRLPDDG